MPNKPQVMQKQKVHGVILIDKPQDMTSQQVVSKVKWLFKSDKHDSKKAGHTGTLDPMATGLLPICLGEATKFSHYQLDADKSYQATLKLGEQTDTGDAEGQVIASSDLPNLDKAKLDAVAQQFSGDILQIPPMYSALKKDGKKLYEYARDGIEIEREARPITIHGLRIEQIDNAHLLLDVRCSKGTYIRTLGEDIANALGAVGHLVALRRSGVGSFVVQDGISLQELEALAFSERFHQLLGVDACLHYLPSLHLNDEQCQRLRLGQRLNVFEQMQSQLSPSFLADLKQTKDSQPQDFRLYVANQKFAGLGMIDKNGRLQPKKMITI